MRGGEVHALLGENGAGKTTLMRIAYGLEAPDAGRIVIGDEPRASAPRSGAVPAAGTASGRLASPRAARALGIGMVHQHFTSIPALTVAENVALAAGWPETGRRAERRAAGVIDRLGLPLAPAAVAGTLSVQLRQRLEIVQALAADARVLLLDEPTAVLAPREVAELVALVRRFAEAGGAVVLITHKLREVASAADRVTVLRGGRVVLSGPAGMHDAAALSRAMIGDDPTPGDSALRARGVPGSAAAPRHDVRVALSTPAGEFRFRGGEIVGLAAIEGNGQRALLRAIAKVEPMPVGVTATVNGVVSFIPEDRTTEALVGEFSLVENFALGHLDRLPRWLDWRAIADQAGAVIAEHGVRVPSALVPAATLSGGNQQRFVLGRALARRPDVIIAEDPSRGLDIRATASVHRQLRAAADAGACVVLHSSDLDEVLDVADRLLVIHAGQLRELPRDAPRAVVGDAMLGIGSGTE